MIKQIEVCDICEKPSTDLKSYTIPYPKEIIACGGRSNKIIFKTMGFSSKEITLCPQCADKVSHEIWYAFGRLKIENELNLKNK